MTALGPSLYGSPNLLLQDMEIWENFESDLPVCPRIPIPMKVSEKGYLIWIFGYWRHEAIQIQHLWLCWFLLWKTRNNLIKLYKKKFNNIDTLSNEIANEIKLSKSWDQIRNSGSSYCESNHILYFSLDKKTKANPTLW